MQTLSHWTFYVVTLQGKAQVPHVEFQTRLKLDGQKIFPSRRSNFPITAVHAWNCNNVPNWRTCALLDCFLIDTSNIFCFVFLSPEQLGQGELNTRSDLDTDNADNLVELSPEEIPIEIMLGKVMNVLRSGQDLTRLSLHQINCSGEECLSTWSFQTHWTSLYHS